MIKKLKLLINSTALIVALAVPILYAAPAHAQLFPGAKDEACKGANLGGGCDTAAAQTQVNTVLENAIGILSVIVGVVSVIMLMIGGFKYVISSGDSNNVNSAKNTILYAVIGLVVAALAQVISRFVVGRL